MTTQCKSKSSVAALNFVRVRGIIIINTGSPASKSKEDVKWFIGAMLSDPKVMTIPNWTRNILAKNIIAPLRCSGSAKHYELIWDNKHDASPLIFNSLKLAEKIESESGMPVEVAMRYGNPDIKSALTCMQKRCPSLHEVVVVPMFPQYAESSYQTVIDEVGRIFYQNSYSFRLKIVEPFYNNQAYIQALACKMRPFVAKPYARLIFCFHSLPLSHEERARKKGKDFDYVYQIKETVRLVSKELGIDPKKNRVVYSSAIGRNWLEPSLTETMKQLPKQGVKNIITLTPGFPADNLESLFDIDIEARDIFMDNGGEEFRFIPCLNSEDYWAHAIIKMVIRKV